MKFINENNIEINQFDLGIEKFGPKTETERQTVEKK